MKFLVFFLAGLFGLGFLAWNHREKAKTEKEQIIADMRNTGSDDIENDDTPEEEKPFQSYLKGISVNGKTVDLCLVHSAGSEGVWQTLPKSAVQHTSQGVEVNGTLYQIY